MTSEFVDHKRILAYEEALYLNRKPDVVSNITQDNYLHSPSIDVANFIQFAKVIKDLA
ncbi:hypothetical protein [Aquimarina sp. Aq78]|uniref:hypothetical protein n=1 Tax=Aquimarina sp. Aq78 TaxID=1191889 RepID=UPI00131D97E0|nr:hypothetical protein [Aquimarina sp. Aq78]